MCAERNGIQFIQMLNPSHQMIFASHTRHSHRNCLSGDEDYACRQIDAIKMFAISHWKIHESKWKEMGNRTHRTEERKYPFAIKQWNEKWILIASIIKIGLIILLYIECAPVETHAKWRLKRIHHSLCPSLSLYLSFVHSPIRCINDLCSTITWYWK